MLKRRPISRLAAWLICGGVSGVLVGSTVALSATSGSRQAGAATVDMQPPAVTHTTPVLTLPGEPVTLRYDLYCQSAPEGPEDGSCSAGGTVYVRAAGSSAFRPLALQVDAAAAEGRYYARVPADVAAAANGFQYFAVLRDKANGTTTTVPTAGSVAPMWSRTLARATAVALGTHVFGAARHADARVVSASWGSGPGQAGLENGTQEQPIGASSFDVDGSGTVSLLDEVNHRLLRFDPTHDGATTVPLTISGRRADLAVEDDGAIDVLESSGEDQPSPTVRSFDATGRLLSTTTVADPVAGQLRVDSTGPRVLEYPSNQWIPIRSGGGVAPQIRAGSGRPVLGGELVVQRVGSEVRIALAGDSGIVRGWRVFSSTPLAEVQLAEPVGNKVLVVVRTYTDAEDEFVALVLDQGGLSSQFSLDSADWAETAPLSRFRVAGGSLYQLGSTADGIFVDRYDLEVTR